MVAHFLAKISGQRGPASRLGSKASGIRSTTASWQGCVNVTLYEKDGVDYANVTLGIWHGAGTQKLLYDGPVSGGKEQC